MNVAAPIRLSTAKDAADYLRFFCSSIGPFYIVDDPSYPRWEASAQKRKISELFKPLVVSADDAKPGYWKATGTVLSGSSLFTADFWINGSGASPGTVDLSIDRVIGTDLPVKKSKWIGIVRQTIQ
jgi:hypothetical protein